MRALNSGEVRALPGTESAFQPFWAPGADTVAFWAGKKLLRVGLQGGSPEQIAETPLRGGGDWNAKGTILFTAIPPSLYQVSVAGGQKQPVTTLREGQTSHAQARFLPDGKRFIFYISGRKHGIYLSSLDGGEPRFLTDADTGGDYLPSGWLLWIQQKALLARRFDLDAATLSGPTLTIAQPVATNGLTFRGAFSVSRTGMIAWREGAGGTRQLVWYSRAGERLSALNAPDDANLMNPELSSDDKRVLVTRGPAGNSDIWVLDDRGSSRLTFGNRDINLWSPDGKSFVYGTNGQGLRIAPTDGSGAERQLGPAVVGAIPNSWSPDGKWILCSLQVVDLMLIPADGSGGYRPFLKTQFSESQGAFSPDGKWVAYQSNESGREEIYVRPFPGPGGVWQISHDGGISARWSRSGKELYFIAPGSRLMAAAINSEGGRIRAGQATPLFTAGGLLVGNEPQYAVSRDGRFLLNVDVASSAPIRLLQNWRPPKQ